MTSTALEARRRRRPVVRQTHLEVQRPRLEELANELRARGYAPEVELDWAHGSGWVLRVPSPRRDLPPELRRAATLTVWCRPGLRRIYRFEWPFAWPLPGRSHDAGTAADYIADMLGPAKPVGGDK